jgi:hypothetical protein
VGVLHVADVALPAGAHVSAGQACRPQCQQGWS